mmetsp:Transcript_45340/g.33118  ORF Transcript_45340/g.33118 Transcript_45340/m.33118 type:complete len:89 (-) Transcript_45340:103-369(-)
MNSKDVDKINTDFCDEFQRDQVDGMLTSQIVSNSIVVINFVLRSINMGLIGYIGYYTESEQTKVVKQAVFLTQFFNTGVLLLLTNANT